MTLNTTLATFIDESESMYAEFEATYKALMRLPFVNVNIIPDSQKSGGKSTVGHVSWNGSSNTRAGFAFALSSSEDIREFGPCTFRFNDADEKNYGHIFKLDVRKGRILFLDQQDYVDNNTVRWSDSAKINALNILDAKLFKFLGV